MPSEGRHFYWIKFADVEILHYLCRTLSTFLFFDAILFSSSPPCPTAGICFVVSREKKLQKI